MIARAGSGWQTVLADLSLILFMVTAAAVAEAGSASDAASAEPVAVWRGESRGDLGQWLNAQPPDPRQRLTLRVRTQPGQEQAALVRALALAAGRPARLVLEPAPGPPLEATLAYDLPPAGDTR